MNPMNAAGTGGAEIRATGTFTSAFSPNIASHTQGNLLLFSRYAVSTYAGSLQGTTSSLQMFTQDDVTEKKTFARTDGVFWGTLDGKKGTFAFGFHFVVDRSACPCPPGANTFEGMFVVIEGTGTGELEGICGSGTFNGRTGQPTVYDYTFRFGKDCKANN